MLSFNKYLNPLYREIDNILDFSDTDRSEKLFSEEYPYLERLVDISASTLTEMILLIQRLEKEIEDQFALIENETGDDKSDAVKIYNQLLKKVWQAVDRANRELEIIDNPYFGKIIVDRKAQEKVPAAQTTAYIGKFAVFDGESRKVLVTDWRAPIANIYYTNSGPKKNISYDSPIGKLHGDLLQKRQFEISGARIKHIYDSKSGNVSADEFLLAQLNRRIGKKLAEIVATIQEQQNEIIRDDTAHPVILQGVAGSGKTTIVLHRLAYLFYTYPKEIDSGNSLIMAPNRMFLDYISNVLPSLGIRGVESNTYLFWAKNILEMNKNMTLSNTQPNLEVKKYKGSYENIQNLKKFYLDYEKDFIFNIPFSDSDLISKRYWELKKNFPKISMKERIDLAIQGTFLSNEVNNALREKTKEISDITKDRIRKYVDSNINIHEIYKSYINSQYNSDVVRNHTKETLTRNTFASDDLPPLIWLHFMLYGTSQYVRDYIVVDEAQDMSLFEIYTLAMVARKNNIFLAGDLAQSIIPPFYIKSWNEVIDMFKSEFDIDIKYFQLNKCYRTTVEVIEYANKILQNYFPKNYQLPEAVLRHGQKVKDIKDSQLLDTINQEIKNESQTIAIICKSENQSAMIYEYLKKQDFDKPVYTYSDSNYKTGILVLPIRKAKGLEFDSVIIYGYQDYHLEKEVDSREFYVGVTRALHRLYIHSNE